MSDTSTPESACQLPEWQCYKTVRAAKILSLGLKGEDQQTVILDDPECDEIPVSDAWVRKHNPQAGGWYVVYADGYASYSPDRAFVEGYIKVSDMPKSPQTFREKLSHAINCHSMENGSNTPDFILAEFLAKCLEAFDAAVQARSTWNGDGNGSSLKSTATEPEAP